MPIIRLISRYPTITSQSVLVSGIAASQPEICLIKAFNSDKYTIPKAGERISGGRKTGPRPTQRPRRRGFTRRSEAELQGKLHLPARVRRTDEAERARPAAPAGWAGGDNSIADRTAVGVGRPENRGIRQVDEFRAEQQVGFLRQEELFRQVEIDGLQPRAAEGAGAAIAEGAVRGQADRSGVQKLNADRPADVFDRSVAFLRNAGNTIGTRGPGRIGARLIGRRRIDGKTAVEGEVRAHLPVPDDRVHNTAGTAAKHLPLPE